jgi:tRNA A-37 threonylcarbamoyl transferase component Bud32
MILSAPAVCIENKLTKEEKEFIIPTARDMLPPLGDYTIPTDEELAEGIVLAGGTDRRVVKVNSFTVVKYGPQVTLDEAANMIFISKHTTIPVPKVFYAYEKNGCCYIFMEFVQGDLLRKIWKSISVQEKNAIVDEWRDYIHQMRQIPYSKSAIGSVIGGPAIDRRQFGAASGGPFASETEFNDWQLAQLVNGTPFPNRDMFAAIMRETERHHRVLFAHGDLATHNIIVRDGRIAAIIDWEFSGWYPEHWDYCKTMSFLGGTDEDYLVGQKVYDEKCYPVEYCMDFWFMRYLRHGGF